MTDLPFEFAFQPDNPAEHAARMAVLYRLYKPETSEAYYPATTEDWRSTFRRILGLWRRQVSELNRLGVYRFENKHVIRERNCHPWGVAVKSYGVTSFYCRRNDICPWCFGRQVSEFYTLLRRTLTPDDAVFTATYTDYFRNDVRGGVTYTWLREKLESARPLMRAMALSNSQFGRAAYWSVTAEPPILYTKHPLDFCVRCRLLVVLPSSCHDYLIRHLPDWKFNRVHNPNESMCQRLVARVCAYPTGLLLGQPEATQVVLNAKIGLRLSEISGDFRGQPVEILEPESEVCQCQKKESDQRQGS